VRGAGRGVLGAFPWTRAQVMGGRRVIAIDGKILTS
jgi:hypothetical protein